jgi:hypothetical protein
MQSSSVLIHLQGCNKGFLRNIDVVISFSGGRRLPSHSVNFVTSISDLYTYFATVLETDDATSTGKNFNCWL